MISERLEGYKRTDEKPYGVEVNVKTSAKHTENFEEDNLDLNIVSDML